MLGRSKFESKIRFVVSQLRQLRRESPVLVEELRNIARNPRVLSALIEERSPWLNRRFLGAASNVAEPFTAGMGLKVVLLSEDCVEVAMPGWWRNQGEGGLVHPGALCVLGEFTSRLFWEHHLDLRHSELRSTRIQTRVLTRIQGDMRAVFRFAVSEREATLHRLRSEGRVEVESSVAVYNGDGRLVAQVEVEWDLARQRMLGAGHGEAGAFEDHESTKNKKQK